MWDTVIGGLLVIAGGLVALGGNYWIETRRWKREDLTRYHQERLAAYRRMYYAVSFDNLGFRQDEQSDIIPHSASSLRSGIDEISLCHSEIVFIGGSDEVAQASAKVNREAQELKPKALLYFKKSGGRTKEAKVAILSMFQPLFGAQLEFLQAARKELGINQLDSLSLNRLFLE